MCIHIHTCICNNKTQGVCILYIERERNRYRYNTCLIHVSLWFDSLEPYTLHYTHTQQKKKNVLIPVI